MHRLIGLLFHCFSRHLEMVVDGHVLLAAGTLQLEAENHVAVESGILAVEAGTLEVEAGTLEVMGLGILVGPEAGTLAVEAGTLAVEAGIFEMVMVGSPPSVAVQYYTVLVGKHLELSWQPLAVADT